MLRSCFKEQVLKTALSKMDVTDPAKLRRVIHLCVNLGKTPGETKTMIESVTNKPSVCRSLVPTGAEVLCHSPYSPDLSPCDLALFPRLKKDELRGATQCILSSFIQEWYASKFTDWVRHHEK